MATPAHTYAGAGTHPVTLTVVDDDGAEDTDTISVTTTEEPPPPTADITYRAAASSNANVLTAAVTAPAAVQTGDVLVLFVSTCRDATISTPSGWRSLGSRLDGTDLRSSAFTRVAATGTAGSRVTVPLDGYAKVDMSLVAYAGARDATVAASQAEAGTGAAHVAPAVAVTASGSRVVRYWVDKTDASTGWPAPGAADRRLTSVGSGPGHASSVTADGAAGAGTAPGSTATSSVSSAKAVGWSVVLGPA